MKFNYRNFLYGLFSLIAGLTVGLLLAIFIALCAFFNSLVTFPLQIYRQSVEASRVRRFQKVFGVSKDFQRADFQVPAKAESIWDKHIRKMEEKNNNNNNN
tara:strand:- start:177 stop:479 length:303 start_codon:yes stop_codon:yes gene_type:complete